MSPPSLNKTPGVTRVPGAPPTTGLEQPGFDPRFDWSAAGAVLLARACPVVVVVDVLRFTTAVEVAVARGAVVVPRRWERPPVRSAGRSGWWRPGLLAGCVSGRELAAHGLAADPALAAEHDVSTAVPRLHGGAFAQLSWPG